MSNVAKLDQIRYVTEAEGIVTISIAWAGTGGSTPKVDLLNLTVPAAEFILLKLNEILDATEDESQPEPNASSA